MKLGFYLRYAIRSLRREGLRTGLGLLSIGIGVMAIVSLQLVGQAFYDATAGNIRVATGGDIALDALNTPLSAAQLAIFQQLQSQGKISVYSAFAQHQGQATTPQGRRINYFDLLVVDPATFPPGGGTIFTKPASGTIATVVQANTVAISDAMRHALNLNIGDTLTITSDDGRVTTATVGGIFEDTAAYGYINNGPFVLMDSGAYTRIPSTAAIPVTYTDVFADVPGHRQDDASAVAHTIQRQIPLSTVESTKDTTHFYQDQSVGFQHFFQIAALLALLIGGVGISNTITALLRRRQTEIAMLKTAGYRQRDLYLLFGLETGLIGLIGGLIGAIAGLGASLIERPILATAFSTPIPVHIDLVTILSGVAIGFLTALIFGVIPIVQSSRLRPLAILRDLPQGRRVLAGIGTVGLVSIVIALYWLVASSVLGDAGLALAAVGGTSIGLLILSVVFIVVVFVLGRLPVKLLPGRWKIDLRMALRNISRQRVRSVTTLVALFTGVFAIGFVLLLGQYIQQQLTQITIRPQSPNALIVASRGDQATINARLQQLGVAPQTVNPIVTVTPTTVRGISAADFVGQFTGSDPGQAEHTAYWALQSLGTMQGYDLAQGRSPDATTLSLVQGVQDHATGHMLGAADAGTHHVVLPDDTSQSPLNLKLGDQITVMNPASQTATTVTVVGFYKRTTVAFVFGTVLADASVVTHVGDAQVRYISAVHFPPSQLDQDLQQVQTAVPTAQITNVLTTAQSASATFNAAANGLEAVASLALLAGLISIANTVTLAMLERRREIGILKSVGYSSQRVLGGVILEVGILSLTGALLAMVLAALFAGLISPGVTFSGNASTYMVDLPIVLGTAVVAMLVGVAIALIVAWGATHVHPLDVLRYE